MFTLLLIKYTYRYIHTMYMNTLMCMNWCYENWNCIFTCSCTYTDTYKYIVYMCVCCRWTLVHFELISVWMTKTQYLLAQFFN